MYTHIYICIHTCAIKEVLFSLCCWQMSHSMHFISSQDLPCIAMRRQMTGKCAHAALPQIVRSSSSAGIQDPACSVGKPKKKLYISSVSSPNRH